MISSKVHARHPTWPPTVQLLPGTITDKDKAPRSLSKTETRYTATLPDITEDEDPFSHFLSPVLDEETSFDEVNYTAGIIPHDSAQLSASRRDALFRARLEEKWETFVARRLLQNTRGNPANLPAPLPPPFPQEPSTPPAEEALPDLYSDPMDLDMPSTPDSAPSSPDQGGWYFPSTMDTASSSEEDEEYDSDLETEAWEAERRRTAHRERGRQHNRPRHRRTLSSGKKHAWREPDPVLYTVTEEDETQPEQTERRGRKRAKTVTWNEEVLVLEYER
ncbi:hypothetical protein ANO11243_013240 [Dothideomycetidae sp. 11243]|nr:hypothetical protein ANO11243_013240 [fungal sp. No.11243]